MSKNTESRILKLEEKINAETGCKIVVVVEDGNDPDAVPQYPEGAPERYVTDNNLCESCTNKDRLCVLYWSGKQFSGDGEILRSDL